MLPLKLDVIVRHHVAHDRQLMLRLRIDGGNRSHCENPPPQRAEPRVWAILEVCQSFDLETALS